MKRRTEFGLQNSDCRIRSIWCLGSWASHIDQGTGDDVSGIIDFNSNGQGDGETGGQGECGITFGELRFTPVRYADFRLRN